MSLLATDRKRTGTIAAAWNGTGTAPANSVFVLSADAGSVLGIQVSGTFTATLQFEGRIAETDDVNDWFAITGVPPGGGAGATSTTAAGKWIFPYSPLRAVRVRCSTYTSGSPVVTMNLSGGARMDAGALAGTTDANTSAGGFNPGQASAVEALHYIYNAALSVWVGVRSANNLSDNAGGGTIPGNANNMFNGPALGSGGFDPERNNIHEIIQAGAATVAGTTNKDIITFNHRALIIHVNVGNYNGGTLLVKAQMQDANGLFVDIPGATTGAVGSGADLFLVVGMNTWPANTAANFYANFPLPRLVRIVRTVAVATVTYSAAYALQV